MPIHQAVKEALGFDSSDEDKKILALCRKATSRQCKPCWEVKYCPYGPLVEDLLLLPTTLESAVAHHEYLQNCLSTDTFGDGQPLDDERRQYFESMIEAFDPDDHPEQIPRLVEEMTCTVFGHICPVFFMAEPLTETEELRRSGRYTSFKTKIRVARRDNYTCQECSAYLRDDNIELDHIIPLSKGGNSGEHNLRLTCFDCNRKKSNKIKI